MELKRILSIAVDGFTSIAIIFAFLILWELLPRIGILDAMFVPPVSKVLTTFWEIIVTGELQKHIFISLKRAITGFGIALMIAIPFGIAMGWYKRFEKFVDPLLQSFRQTSALALLPVFILTLGIGEISKVAVIFWATQWPLLLSTISGVKYVDPLLIKSARSMGVNDIVLFRKVILPAAVPSIMVGVRLAATYSILLLVAAEMIGAKSGLGFLIINAQSGLEITKMYAAIVTLSLIGITMNYLLVWLERRLTLWKEDRLPI